MKNRFTVNVAFIFLLLGFFGTVRPAVAQTTSDTSDAQKLQWLTYQGSEPNDGTELPGKGRHLVFVAADQEYRSEQSMPMLARLLSTRYGFDCTVLFSVNKQGLVDPTLPAPHKDKGQKHNIPGLEKLQTADGLILLSRFMQLPDDQLKHFHDYFDSGKPIIALRTANHGFYGDMGYRKDNNRVSLRELFGGTFMGHHGGWHREATRGMVTEDAKSHPIVRGVKDIFGPSDVYRCHNEKSPLPESAEVLVMGQPLKTLKQDAEPNTEKEPLPIAWTTTWTGNQGKQSRIFHFTMGSARDFENDGVRRLTINAIQWSLGMEDTIDPNRSVEIVGTYEPLKSGFNYEKLGVQPKPVSEYK
ncbi:MAG: ThuA domain-containing protein [Planctomycetota bacterium]